VVLKRSYSKSTLCGLVT